MPTPTGFSVNQISVHRIVAILMVLKSIRHEIFSQAIEKQQKTDVVKFSPFDSGRVAEGTLILLLARWRIAVHCNHGAVDLLMDNPKIKNMTPCITIIRLYLLLLLLPLYGIMVWSAGLHQATQPYGDLRSVLLALVLLYLHAALYRHFSLRNNIMRHMPNLRA